MIDIVREIDAIQREVGSGRVAAGEGRAVRLRRTYKAPIGWDMGLLGLELHLRGGSVGDPEAWQLSAEGREFATRSSGAWGAANVAAGANPAAAGAAVANTTAFYAPEPDADS